jgi:hypothetical protein
MMLRGVAACLVMGSAVFAGGAASVTFSRDVAPVLYQRCVECHRQGEVLPKVNETRLNTRRFRRIAGYGRYVPNA